LKGPKQALLGLRFYKKELVISAFDNFNAKKIAKYDSKKRASLLKDAGIVRNRLKIKAVIENAKVFLEIQKEYGSFDKYIWQFVGGKPLKSGKQPSSSRESDEMSKALKMRGFKFVGSTICYAFMQAVGMVNDHTSDCFRAKRK
jgi:DNA-3-methyladenine glycosylase I